MYSDHEMNRPACGEGMGCLPSCAPLAVPFVPFQPAGGKRYSQNDALNNGTLFPGLNLPFHVKNEASNVVSGPLAELQALEFVLLELGLYLDTHRNDEEAFALFQQYAALEKAGREKYESMYGPLFQRSTANGDCFCGWIQDPWPWNFMEGEGK
ncbi:MAG: spore coat protein CotJB [Clostridiales bacterium]|nr:spore coat protein CotJB [Clostridiales bacterium]